MHFTYKKFCIVKNHFANICTTSGKWVVSILWSYNFIKTKTYKHLLSFMLFIICTMVNSINFTYLGSWKQLLKMLSWGATFWLKYLIQKGAPYILPYLISLWAWNAFFAIKVTSIKEFLLTIIFCSSTLWVLA